VGGATIQHPADGAVVSGTVAITLSIMARANFANLYIDGRLYASRAASKLTWNSSAVPDGMHVFSVRSFSNRGRFLGGQAVMVVVQNRHPRPSPIATSTATIVATPTPSTIPTPAPTTAALIITAPGDGTHVEGTISFAAIKSSNAQ